MVDEEAPAVVDDISPAPPPPPRQHSPIRPTPSREFIKKLPRKRTRLFATNQDAQTEADTEIMSTPPPRRQKRAAPKNNKAGGKKRNNRGRKDDSDNSDLENDFQNPDDKVAFIIQNSDSYQEAYQRIRSTNPGMLMKSHVTNYMNVTMLAKAKHNIIPLTSYKPAYRVSKSVHIKIVILWVLNLYENLHTKL